MLRRCAVCQGKGIISSSSSGVDVLCWKCLGKKVVENGSRSLYRMTHKALVWAILAPILLIMSPSLSKAEELLPDTELDGHCVKQMAGEIQVNCRTRINNLTVSSAAISNLSVSTGSFNSLSIAGVSGGFFVLSAPVFSSSTLKTDAATTTYTAAGPSASITPKSTASRILVCTSGLFWNSNDAASNAQLTIFRGATDLDVSGNGMHRTGSGFGAVAFGDYVSICLIDSPATASSVTYQVYIKRQNGTSTISYPFDPGAKSSMAFIILVEVK